jgi:uncharacterized protein (DUF58 family)
MAGSYHSVFKGRGMSFDEVRPYQAGDEIRFIDWNVTARTGDPYVKQFVEERELTVVVVVDVSSSMNTGSGSMTRRDAAAELAATVAFSAIQNGDRVGLLMFAEGFKQFIPPKKTRAHGLRVIREILAADHFDQRGTGLSEALSYLGLILKRRSIVFLVSDFLDVEGLDRDLRGLTQRHDVVPLHIRDPRDEDPANLGAVLARDPETGGRVRLPLGFRRFRETFAKEVRAQIGEVEAVFRRNGTRVVPIQLGESPVGPLLQYFQLRARRY